MSPYRERYHRKLDDLVDQTRDLANQASSALGKSVAALRESNVDLAKEVIKMIRAWTIRARG